MKVGELIDRLKELDPDLPLLLSRDEEGNGFNALYEVVASSVDGDGSPIHPDDLSEWDPEDVTSAVILWP